MRLPMRKPLWPALAVILWCVLLAARAAAPPLEVDSVSIPVSDMERSVGFYRDVLSFIKVADREVHGAPYEKLFGVFGVRLRAVRMRLGEEFIELVQFQTPRGRPLPADSRSNDRWFQHVAIIVSDMDRAYAELRAHRLRYASPAPQRLPDWNPNAGGIEAFYFRDPDDNHLEVLAFPPGKGAARWQRKDALFLGIDHTAIVVTDTERSLAFYRDQLGLAVAGASENYGPEQERLNNVLGARLRITALRGARGPGIEFLQYLAPLDGRAIPADSRATDAWYWQINLTGADAVRRAQRLDARRVSEGVAEFPARELGAAAGIVVRDPDGHANFIYGASP
jgi:catechol 2,3-dioxygenase-like lactoylglutathione lyase family enzyme